MEANKEKKYSSTDVTKNTTPVTANETPIAPKMADGNEKVMFGRRIEPVKKEKRRYKKRGVRETFPYSFKSTPKPDEPTVDELFENSEDNDKN